MELNVKMPPLLSNQISNDIKITTFAAEDRQSNHSAGTAEIQVITTMIQQNMNPLKMQHHFQISACTSCCDTYKLN